MIEKLNGRDKVIWLIVSNKVNEIIDELEVIRKLIEDSIKKNEEETIEGDL